MRAEIPLSLSCKEVKVDITAFQKGIEPHVSELGYEIIECEFKKQFGEDTLTVYIYKKEGVTLNDCETVSNALDAVLEELDPTNGAPYNLNVSSPGLDRPIKSKDDFRRNKGEDVEAVFLKSVNDRKRMHGILSAYDDDTVTLTVGHKTIILERNNIKELKKYIKF